MEKSQGLAESLIIAGGCERLAVVVEHANVDQRRRHRQFLVAVLATSFDQHGDELRAEHLLEPRHVSLGPAVVGVADDFAGTRELARRTRRPARDRSRSCGRPSAWTTSRS